MSDYVDEAMRLVAEVIRAAKRDGILRQSSLEPRAREALRRHLETAHEQPAPETRTLPAWIPPGWKLVPIEPTPAMVNAPFVGRVEDQSVQGQRRRRTVMAENWQAMVRAAPTCTELQTADPDSGASAEEGRA